MLLLPESDFERDDAFTKRKRDELLVPYYRRRFLGGGFVLLDEGRTSKVLQQRGVDTIAWARSGHPIAIEEKIVRWKGRKYESICLETESCTRPGHISRGWAWYSMADRLLYCMEDEEGDLDCVDIDFPALHGWFWPREKDFALHVMPHTINMTANRLVPIDLILDAVPDSYRFLVTKGGVDQ
jgi:hypothetical protein